MAARIMCADDEPGCLSSLTAIVKIAARDAKIEVVIDEARTQREVLDQADRNAYSLIFLDDAMPPHAGRGPLPGIGCETVRQLRERGEQMPLYLVTGSNSEDEALRAGATGYISKKSNPHYTNQVAEAFVRHCA